MIKRAARHERFYIVSHELIDADLSAEALGVAVYVLSRPDDWEIYQSQLRKKFKCGKHVMSRILKEIVEAGFAYVEQGRAESGEFDSNTWVFLESPLTDYPLTDKPTAVNQPLLNKDNKLNTNNTYSYGELSNCILLTSTFEFFWHIYPRHEAKQAAKKAWVKLKPNEEVLTSILNNIWDRKHNGEFAADRLSYLPHPATYLNGARWEDSTTPRVIKMNIQGRPDSIRGTSILEELTDTGWAN